MDAGGLHLRLTANSQQLGCPRLADSSVYGVSSEEPPPEVSHGHIRRDPKGSGSRHPKRILCYWSPSSQSPNLTHISTISSINAEIHAGEDTIPREPPSPRFIGRQRIFTQLADPSASPLSSNEEQHHQSCKSPEHWSFHRESSLQKPDHDWEEMGLQDATHTTMPSSCSEIQLSTLPPHRKTRRYSSEASHLTLKGSKSHQLREAHISKAGDISAENKV